MATEYTFTSADIARYNADNVICHRGGGTMPLWNAGDAVATSRYVYFNAKEGYEIKTPPYAEYKNGFKVNFEWFADTKSWYFQVNSGSTRGGYKGFFATAVKAEPPKPVRYKATADDVALLKAKNVTGTFAGATIKDGLELQEGQEIVLTCPIDTAFEYAQAMTMSGLVNPFTMSSNDTVAKFTAGAEDLQGYDFDTKFNPFVAMEITQEVLNSINSDSKGFINDEPMKVGDKILLNDTIKFVCSGRGISYEGVHILSGANNSVTTMTLSEGNTVATLKWVKRAEIKKFNFYMIEAYPKVYTFDEEKYKYFTDRNSKPFANDVELKVGDSIRKGDTISIKTDTGYEFLTGEKVQIFSYLTVDMDLNENRTVATYYWRDNSTIYSFDFTTVKSAKVETDTTNNTYLITPRELRNLEALNLKEFDPDGNLLSDYSNLLVGVMKYPFSIPDDNQGAMGGIYVGHKQYNEVKAVDVDVDILEIDLGTIKVDDKFKDLRDYANTEAILRLPNLEGVSIDLEYVIGQTIGVKYIVNLVNGDTTVVISSSKLPDDNNTVLTLKATIGTPVPIAHKDGWNYQPIDASGTRIGGENFVSKPTIDIVRNEQVNGDSMFTIPVKDSGKLTDFTGWTKIDDIVLTVNATQQEKQEIIALLKTGVFFNE